MAFLADIKRAEPRGEVKPLALIIAERYMDVWTGQWTRDPFNSSIYDMTEEEEYIMLGAEYAARTVRVWSRDQESKTAADFQYQQWVMSD